MEKDARVSDKLDAWSRTHYHEYFDWIDEGNEPTYDESVLKLLNETIYNPDFKTQMDSWTQDQYIKFREELIHKSHHTVYFPELICYLSDWNVKFGVK